MLIKLLTVDHSTTELILTAEAPVEEVSFKVSFLYWLSLLLNYGGGRRILGCSLRYYFGANLRYTLTKCIFFTVEWHIYRYEDNKVFQRSAPQYDLF